MPHVSFIHFRIAHTKVLNLLRLPLLHITMVLHETTYKSNALIMDFRDYVLVVDNATMPKQKPSDMESSIDPSMPPLRPLKKFDVRRLNTARKVRQRHQTILALQRCDSDDEEDEEDGEELADFQKMTFSVAPLSRWDNSVSKAISNETSTNNSRPILFGNDNVTPLLPTGWKASTQPTVSSASHCSGNGKLASSKLSPFSDSPSHRLTLVHAMPQGHFSCSSSPVRMPVRKQSFDSVPRKPIRPGSPRSSTMSILDEALSVCDMCTEELNGTVSQPLLAKSIPSFPCLDKK
jgi:hypothetical protein